MFKTRLLGAGVALALAMTVATPANAAVISFTPDFAYSGDDYTGVITFTLEDVVGGVQFTIDWETPAVPNPGEFLTGAYLNLDPALNPITDVTLPPGLGTCTGCSLSSISQGADAFKANGDGFYDLLFNFPQANQGGRFNQGDSYTILLGGNITAASFLFTDVGGAKGDYYATARVQGLLADNEGSGWAGAGGADARADDPDDPPVVPEPALLALMGLGLAFGAGRLRRARS